MYMHREKNGRMRATQPSIAANNTKSLFDSKKLRSNTNYNHQLKRNIKIVHAYNCLNMRRKKRGFCNWFNFVAVIWIIVSQILYVYCLKDLKIFVPEAVITGNAATLTCQYELEQVALYSVRWYFENEEFYRYVPKESPPSIVFPVSGITVDKMSSDSTSVTLRSITRELTGKFKCEVSEDAPTFHTAIRDAYMQVVELPKEEPILHVDKKIIGINESIKAVCNVGKSYPAANITWYINSKKVNKNPHQRVVYQRSVEGSDSISSLDIQSSSPLIQDIFAAATKYHPSINLMCEVSILHVYNKNVDVKLATINPSLTTITPNLLGLEKSIGDPDNSPLTGGSGHFTHQSYVSFVAFAVLICYRLVICNVSL